MIQEEPNEVCGENFPMLSLSSLFAQDFDSVTVEMIDGKVEIKQKLAEYVNRGDALESWSYLDFFLGTYDGKTLKVKTSPRGRPPNIRVPYKPNTQPQGRCRILRSSGHDTMPYFPACWLARRMDNAEGGLYEASILALLKPWRSLTDVKDESQSFRTAFDHFLTTTSQENRNMVENMDFFHESSRTASANHASTDNAHNIQTTVTSTDEVTNANIDNVVPPGNNNWIVTEEIIASAIDRPFSTQELKYADNAISVGNAAGAFAVHTVHVLPTKTPLPATPEQINQFSIWQTAVANFTAQDLETEDEHGHETIQPNSQLINHPPLHHNDTEPNVTVSTSVSQYKQITNHSLNDRQTMAFNIIINHLDQHLQGKKPPQRLLIVHGQGGTGKSTLLNAISQAFQERNVSHLLAKTATSGVAATMICGQTLHTWAALLIKIPTTDRWLMHPGKATDRRRKRNVGRALWLMIDEMSMLTTPTLEFLSCVGCVVRASLGIDGNNTGVAFGNLNVVLLGDFHQFPPVATSKRELYSDCPIKEDIPNRGRSLYKQFNTVIKLDQQMRICDHVWNGILHCLRTGDCTKSDIAEIRKLVLGHQDCVAPDFTKPPWNDAVLVTPRNGACAFWNEKALEQHCRNTQNTLFTFYANDTFNDSDLTPQQRLSVAYMNRKQTGLLPHKIDIAIGMKSMVLLNIATDADLANGTRGTVVDIILNASEDIPHPNETNVRLHYPPAVILFRPLYEQNKKIAGLPDGVLPIFPTRKKFSLPGHDNVMILREQYALTPTYAFTDYKSQGQTIESVIVDLGRPPSGKLSAFNAYVALSRSRGRSTIRLLRDFDDNLFTIHPHEGLRREDERLSVLEADTIRRYRDGEFGSFGNTVDGRT